MTLLWLVLVASVLGILWYAGWLADDVVAVAWPEETPLHSREERARDQRLTKLVRLVGAPDVREVHGVVVSVAEQFAHDQPLDPVVRRFLEAPPLSDPDRYRRDLATVLTRLEAP